VYKVLVVLFDAFSIQIKTLIDQAKAGGDYVEELIKKEK
jgi:hypothetical protein